MTWTSKDSNEEETIEKTFTIKVNDKKVPGILWTPKEHTHDRLVLLGHGGTEHKKSEHIQFLASELLKKGISCMAIDGPGHGERSTTEFNEGSNPDLFKRVWEEGGGHFGMLEDWKESLSFVEMEMGPVPTGWWGLSMGTMMGLPISVVDTRIRIAVLGLMGVWGPNKEHLKTLAPKLDCPVMFLVQWDDEVVPRDKCLELYDLLGTNKKTLHINPGKHVEVPFFEINNSIKYLDKYLK